MPGAPGFTCECRRRSRPRRWRRSTVCIARAAAHAGRRPMPRIWCRRPISRRFARPTSFEPGTNLRAWLFTILHNTARNRARDRARDLVAVDSDAVERRPISRRRPAGADTPETLLLRDTLAPELQAAIDALPEAFRQAVWLRDVEEFSYAEIARCCQIPIGTVMSRISRGRQYVVRTPESLAACQCLTAYRSSHSCHAVSSTASCPTRIAARSTLILRALRVLSFARDRRARRPRPDSHAPTRPARGMCAGGAACDVRRDRFRLRSGGRCASYGRHAARGRRHAARRRRARRAPLRTSARTARRGARALRPYALAASLVVVVGGAFVYQATDQSARIMAAQLTADHVKCFAHEQRARYASGRVDAVESSHAFQLRLEHASARRKRRAWGSSSSGARPCLYGEGRVAHIMYRHDGRPVSLFMLPKTRAHAGARRGARARGGDLVRRQPHVRADRAASRGRTWSSSRRSSGGAPLVRVELPRADPRVRPGPTHGSALQHMQDHFSRSRR